MTFDQIPDHLEMLLTDVSRSTAGWTSGEWRHRRAPGKWSRLEILGHLTDSARNNLERLVRAMERDSLEWPSYQQDSQVRVQRYHDASSEAVMVLWQALNRHFAFVLRGVPPGRRSTPCRIGDNPTCTLNHLVLDYVAHLEHHLRQIFENSEIRPPYSGLIFPLPLEP